MSATPRTEYCDHASRVKVLTPYVRKCPRASRPKDNTTPARTPKPAAATAPTVRCGMGWGQWKLQASLSAFMLPIPVWQVQIVGGGAVCKIPQRTPDARRQSVLVLAYEAEASWGFAGSQSA